MTWIFGYVGKQLIFMHLDWIRRDTPYVSVLSPNAWKEGPEKLRVRTLFSQTINYSTQLVPNLSRSKGNQKMKFGHIIEYNMRNIFLEKSYTKCGGKTNSRAISKKSKLDLSLNQHYEHLCSLILLYVKVKDYQNILKLKC